jgi:hypothetical protein
LFFPTVANDFHGLGALGRMKTITTFLFVACGGITYLCSSLIAEEIKYPSLDGRFALRIIGGPGFGEGKVELIEKATGRLMVDLGTTWRSQVLVWSPDSKWAAYANRGDKEGEVKVYFWDSSTFEEASLPDDFPSPDIKLPKESKSGHVKNYGGAVTPLRWLKSGDLELSSDLMMLTEDGRTYTGVVRFTLAFDSQHHASVKKVGKTKTEVDE